MKLRVKRISMLSLCLIGFMMTACKDYLNLIPKNQKIVSNVEDVKAELLSYWAATTYSTLLKTSYGNSAPLSLPIFNDVNIQLALYEDNMDMLAFKEHSDINDRCMTYYYQDIDWKGTSLASSLWQNCYVSIGFMNAILDDLDKVTATQAERETIGGEARVIRAWNILKLIQFFAPYKDNKLGVPLNLDSENVTPGDRRTQTEIYGIIERELKEVLEYTTPREKWNFFYSPSFVKSCLAEMYMFRAGSAAAKDKDWEMAEKYSGEVIATYVPENRVELLMDMFSGESVSYTVEHPYCALKLATSRFFGIGNQSTGIWGSNNAQQVSSELWLMYEPEDIRRKAWFRENEDEGRVRRCISKPVVYYYGPVCDILVLYRKADLFLINAEAKCRLGQESEAARMIEDFRRARIPGYNTSVTGDILAEVLKERRLELCFENGSRWLDMKRLGISCTRSGFDKESSGTKEYTLDANDYRYALPIPTDIELDYNDISQNPGWTNFN